MTSLRKRKNSVVWWEQYYVVNKETQALKQVRKSTGQSDKKQAMTAAVKMERAAQGVKAAGSEEPQRAKAILAGVVAGIGREESGGGNPSGNRWIVCRPAHAKLTSPPRQNTAVVQVGVDGERIIL